MLIAHIPGGSIAIHSRGEQQAPVVQAALDFLNNLQYSFKELGVADLFIVCLIGLAGFAIPIILLVGGILLYGRVKRIEERLEKLDQGENS